ncbi:MAG TPA: ATP-binding protein, partial [Candidatus Sumerlaeia bacterium]|nr:ATP-binding protein [Candidatus Sumerlaeia bacterium]
GVMTARKFEVYEYTDVEITLFETISKQVAIVIEKARLYHQKITAEKMAMVSVSLSEIAHYIKNILQSMEGGAWFVDRGLKSGDIEKAQNGWKLLQKSIKKISYLVENMLNYSRPIHFDLERGNINALLVEILNSVVDTAAERHVEIKPDFAQNLPDIFFDWDRMYDSLLNMISNAMDAIPEERAGLIILKSSYDKEKKRVIVEIIDNGTGIPEESRERIFLLFFSTKGRRGTGIGLTVTKKVIEEHGGKIWFETKTDEGTRFVIELPLSENKKISQMII